MRLAEHRHRHKKAARRVQLKKGKVGVLPARRVLKLLDTFRNLLRKALPLRTAVWEAFEYHHRIPPLKIVAVVQDPHHRFFRRERQVVQQRVRLGGRLLLLGQAECTETV